MKSKNARAAGDHPNEDRARPSVPLGNRPNVSRPNHASAVPCHADLRRGVCLLNAGRFDEACAAFARAAQVNQTTETRSTSASPESTPAPPIEPVSITPAARECIRQSLELVAAGRHGEAITALRTALRDQSECAELHHQLALLLAAEGQYDEAALRFNQVLNINRSHVDAMVNLALCCAASGNPRDAIAPLQRAQALRPDDAQIGLLLAQAARASTNAGDTARVRATMPAEASPPTATVRAIAEMIEHDADVADALLATRAGQLDRQLVASVASALEDLVERHPDRADLRFQLGRAHEQLGRRDVAIVETERAAALDPTLTRAMIELGRLYQLSDQRERAIEQLELATQRGAAYADVYYRLGNLYRDAGRVEQARGAFERALSINGRYAAAAEALEAITH